MLQLGFCRGKSYAVIQREEITRNSGLCMGIRERAEEPLDSIYNLRLKMAVRSRNIWHMHFICWNVWLVDCRKKGPYFCIKWTWSTKFYIWVSVHNKSIIWHIIIQQDANLAILCLLKTTSMLYMFQTPFASIFRSTINCNSSHWCLSWVLLE